MNRRQSVTPTSSKNWRSNSFYRPTIQNGYSENTSTPSSQNRPESAASGLKRMSKMFSIDKTREKLRVALEDPDRVRYTNLACIHEELVKELKQLKGFVNDLARGYESSRGLDPVRRYKKLQSMTKTIVLNFRLTEPGTPDSENLESSNGLIARGDVLKSNVKMNQMKLKHEKVYDSFSSEESTIEIERLARNNYDLQTHIDHLNDAVNALNDRYQSLKREPFIKRYNMLKCALKEVEKLSDIEEQL